MSISKRTLALFHRALLYQGGSGIFNNDIANAITRIVTIKELKKFDFSKHNFFGICSELEKIGKPNKRNKKAKVKQ